MEQISLDGPIGLSATIAVGVCLLALFAWALHREQGFLGLPMTILFGLLRSAALIAALWMLTGPTKVLVETSTTRRAIAIVTDVSGSMRTVDPPTMTDDLRWATSRLNGTSALQSADRAVAAFGIAQQHLQTVSEALRQRLPESAVAESTTAADTAIQRTKAHLSGIAEASETASDVRTLAAKIVETLDGAEFKDFSQLCRAFQKGRTPSQTGWRESLGDLEYRVTAVHRSMRQLASLAAEKESERIAGTDPALLASIRNETRIAKAAGLVDNLQRTVLKATRVEADVHMSSFDRSFRPLDELVSPGDALRKFSTVDDEAEKSASGTNIASLLTRLRQQGQEQPLAAVFVLSDFGHNEPDNNPLDAAATLARTPVYVVPIGNSQRVRDVILQSVSAPAVTMRNDDVVLEARIQAFDCQGEVCVVRLTENGETIDFHEVAIDSGLASRTVRFERRMPTVGDWRFQLSIAPLEGELSEQNNYGEVEVRVTRSDIKVLLADELPRWEYRYLSQLFRRDPKVDCDELLFQPRAIATGRREESKTFPVTVDDWDQYDVVLLGDLRAERLPTASQESLVEYLRTRGGALILIAGQDAMPHGYVDHPLEEILPVLPVDESVAKDAPAYSFRLTTQGRDQDALLIGETQEATRLAWDFVNRYSPMRAVSVWRQPRASARTLIAAVGRDSLDEEAEAKASAFLCWQPVGRGRVAYLSAPETYRLRFLRGDRLHYRFWGQLLRWAIASDLSAGSKFVRIRSDKSRYEVGDSVNVTVRLADREGQPVLAEDLRIRIAAAEGERTVPLEPDPQVPGEYLAAAGSLPPGVYHIEPEGAAVDELYKEDTEERESAGFTVQADLPLEMVDVRCDRALAQQIADRTGGQVLPPTAVEEILELTDLRPVVSERIETRPLWLKWKYLWLIFGCLQAEWMIRKWKGLS